VGQRPPVGLGHQASPSPAAPPERLRLAQPPLVFARWKVGASGPACTHFLNRRGAPKRRPARRSAATVLAAVSLATGVWWLAAHLTPIDPRVAHVAHLRAVWWVFTFPTMRRRVFAGVIASRRAAAR